MMDPSSAAVHVLKPDARAWGEGALRLEEEHTGATYPPSLRPGAAWSIATTVGRRFLFLELRVFERGPWALVEDGAAVAEGIWTRVGEDLILRVPREGMPPEFLVTHGETRASMTPDGLAIRCSVSHLPVVSFKVDDLRRSAWLRFQRTLLA